MQLFERCSRVLLVVQRERWTMAREAFSICVLGILFLQLCRVRQEYLQKIDGRCCGKNRPGEPVSNQPRQVTRVVDVSMSEEHPIDRPWFDWEVFPIA